MKPNPYQFSSEVFRDSPNLEAALEWRNPRLYIGLYHINEALRQVFRVAPQEYFLWTFLVGPPEGAPQEQECIRYRRWIGDLCHSLEPGEVEYRQIWKMDRDIVPSVRHKDIVARVLIAEIENVKALEESIQNAWPEQTVHVENSATIPSPSRDWVQRIVETGGGGAGAGGGGEVLSCEPGRMPTSKPMPPSILGQWAKIEAYYTDFALRAAAESASGSTSTSTDTIPTFDMLKMTEIS